MRLIDADALEREGWFLSRNRMVDEKTMVYEVKKPTEFPAIEPERKTQWIPCSETVDIPDHEVLACDKYGEELIGWLLYSDDQWLCKSDGEMMYDPIAWMEKPEPYKEEG